jgi:hypothetical protein
MEKIKEILDRKAKGQDCTEEESAEIKMFVKEHIVQIGNGEVQLIEQIQEFFPIEYGEAIDENPVKKKLHKTVIQIEILSEENTIGLAEDLSVVEYEINRGGWSGQLKVIERFEVEGEEAVKICLEQGSDPVFFFMDEKGNDIGFYNEAKNVM